MTFMVRPPFSFPQSWMQASHQNAMHVRAPEIGKWHRQGEYQPAVGVLLLTQGVDGDEGTGL